MTRTLIVDGANVVGSRPDGWWKDRAGAAQRLHARLDRADLDFDRVVLVLEGKAKAGVAQADSGPVEIVHAPREGDDEIVEQAGQAVRAGEQTTVATADRGLESRVRAVGAAVMAPGSLLHELPD
ncbi:NYN domain-containing protein [Flexivirga meconopsidis]|uniref:NYN domain-containing protein n=1 Tax=Flexivirga meconopsidis TaxID=2977121 RepID=UPI00223F4F0A|nr:NYN domain-containing protein [Flexivirga meconopsidis]